MQNALTSYTENEILTAEPEKLVLLMYEGAIKFIRQARTAVSETRVEEAHTAILRAYAIIAELQATLDKDKGGEIATGLERSYDFMLNQLRESDIKKDEKALAEVESLLIPLAETWKKAFFSRNVGEITQSLMPQSGGAQTVVSGNGENASDNSGNSSIQKKEKSEPVARTPGAPGKPSGSVDLRG